MTVDDGFAYIAGGLGLSIFDVRDPANPQQLVSKFRTGVGERLARSYVTIATIKGTKYALFGGGDGLAIIDVSDPSAPNHITKVYTGVACSGQHGSQHSPERTGGGCYAFLGPTGRHAYVVGNGLAIVNVSDPANAVTVKNMYTGVCSREGGGTAVIDGNYLYVVGGWGGLAVFDIREAENPIKVAQTETTVFSIKGMSSIRVEGGLAYVGGGCGFAIMDVSLAGAWEPLPPESGCCVVL